MAYSKKTWADQEVITAAALNNIETGIANAALASDLSVKAKKVAGAVAKTCDAAAAAPTKAEFDKVVADIQTLVEKINAMNA